MPAISSLTNSMLLNSGLAQYPDEKLYNAATLLKPDERPTVPVHVAPNDPQQFYILKRQPKTEALTNDKASGTPGITVFKDTPSYDSPDTRLLAALLAHEAVHAKRDDYDERPAYQQQLKITSRLTGREYPELIKALQEQIVRLNKTDGRYK